MLDLLCKVDIDHAGDDARTFELYRGDVTRLSADEAVDFLCLSALPNDYESTPESVIGRLRAAGVTLQEAAADKAACYKPVMPYWISRDMQAKGLHFKRLLVFDPVDPGTAAVRYIPLLFRALRCFAGDRAVSVALPMLAAGSGGANLERMLRELFFSAAHWASLASWPLRSVKLIFPNDDRVAPAVSQMKALAAAYRNPPLALPALPPRLAAKLHAGNAGNAALPPGMTQKQYKYIQAYTKNSIFLPINRALRLNDPTNGEYIYWLPSIEAISSGLANLPDFSGDTIRCVNLSQKMIDNYWRRGSIITHFGFTSSSRRIGNPPSFMWDTNCRLEITSHTGKNIESLSCYPEEHEVLYDHGMRDEVLWGVEEKGGGADVRTFGSEETTPDYCRDR